MIKAVGSYHPSRRIIANQTTQKDRSELRRTLTMTCVYLAGFSLFIGLALLDGAVN